MPAGIAARHCLSLERLEERIVPSTAPAILYKISGQLNEGNMSGVCPYEPFVVGPNARIAVNRRHSPRQPVLKDNGSYAALHATAA